MVTNSSIPENGESKRIKELVVVLRALVSSLKPPILLSSLLRDFKAMEFRELPFRDFGFATPEDFLRNTGEFRIDGSGPNAHVSLAKINVKSAHIVSMVARQRPSKSSGAIHPFALPTSRRSRPPRQRQARPQNFKYPPQPYRMTASLAQNQPQKSIPSQITMNQTQQRSSMVTKSSAPGNGENKRIKEVIVVLRALVSSLKPPILLSKLLRDFKAIEFRELPYREFGFKTAVAFLISTREFHIEGSGANVYVSLAKINEKSAHIISMVARQKPSKSAGAIQSISHRIRSRQRVVPVHYGVQRQKSFNEARLLGATFLKPLRHSDVVLISHRPLPGQNIGQPEKKSRSSVTQNQAQQAIPSQPTIKERQPQNEPLTSTSQPSDSGPLPDCGGIVVNMLNTLHTSPRTNVFSVQKLSQNLNDNRHGDSTNKNPSPVLATPEKPVQKASVLAPMKQPKLESNINVTPPSKLNSPNEAPHEKLREGVHEREIEKTEEFKYSDIRKRSEKSLRFCIVSESTMEPVELQSQKSNVPKCNDSCKELALRLYNKLKNRTNGVFVRKLPEWFENEFQMMLPENWEATVHRSDLFIIEKGEEEDFDILYANTKPKNEIVIRLEDLQLPWELSYWNILITECRSSKEIWGRLIELGYEERFKSLQEDMETYMESNKSRPQLIQLNNIYLVWKQQMWFRVRVEEMSSAAAQCFYIDLGVVEWLPILQLYECEAVFLTLPAQAVHFTLFGLEDFAGHPYAKEVLDSFLLQRTKRAHVLNKETKFCKASGENQSICVVIYNVSTYTASVKEDVPLNDVILEAIIKSTPKVFLKCDALTSVVVSHISDDGHLYLQIQNDDLNYVQSTLRRIAQTKLNPKVHVVRLADLPTTSTFLVCHKKENEEESWYRGVLANDSPLTSDGFVEIFHVDCGNTQRTHITSLYRLDSISAAMAQFPPQALRVALANIPPTNDVIINRIRGMLPLCSEVFVKLEQKQSDDVPLVTLYKESAGFSVNDAIRMQHKFEKQSKLSCHSEDSEDSIKSRLLTSEPNAMGEAKAPGICTFITDMCSSMTDTEPKNGLSEPQTIREYDGIPPVGKCFKVLIMLASTPTDFIVQPYADCQKLAAMMMNLQNYCEDADALTLCHKVEKGQAYAVKNHDGFYYRAIVINTYDDDLVHVRFCDFGDTIVVRRHNLKDLPQLFRQLPQMAMQATLYGIKPLNSRWAADDCQRFRGLTEGKIFAGTIKAIGKSYPEGPLLELELSNVLGDDKDVHVHELLIKEGRAVKSNSIIG